MAKEITPKQVAKQFEWDINRTREFCALALEEANDHNLALAIWAVDAGDFGLAREFLEIEAEHLRAGYLTEEMNERRKALLERLRVARNG